MSIYLGTTPLADGASTALLAGKADTNLGNTNISSSFATKLNSAGIRTVTQTYVNGTSWYRVWSDGWCEQGGATNKATNISLLKSYANTNYIITSGLNGTSSSGEIPAFNKTTSSFTVSQAYATSLNFMWQACGYIS
jgi:hypothetical protein